MAQIEVSGMTSYIHDLAFLGEIMPFTKPMLRAQADVVELALRKSILAEDLVETARLLGSIDRNERMTGKYGFAVIVGPSGVHHHYITDTSVGEIRSGHLGYVFEYGAPGKNIKARHWVLKAVNQCRDNALDAAEAVFNDYLEQLHL